jgi:hypothetical protein
VTNNYRSVVLPSVEYRGASALEPASKFWCKCFCMTWDTHLRHHSYSSPVWPSSIQFLFSLKMYKVHAPLLPPMQVVRQVTPTTNPKECLWPWSLASIHFTKASEDCHLSKVERHCRPITQLAKTVRTRAPQASPVARNQVLLSIRAFLCSPRQQEIYQISKFWFILVSSHPSGIRLIREMPTSSM